MLRALLRYALASRWPTARKLASRFAYKLLSLPLGPPPTTTPGAGAATTPAHRSIGGRWRKGYGRSAARSLARRMAILGMTAGVALSPTMAAWMDVRAASFAATQAAFGFYYDGIESHAVAVANDDVRYIPVRASGTMASTPDSVPTSITGDLDIHVLLCLPDYTPASAGTVFNKWLTTGNQRSWRLRINADGTVTLQVSTNGSSTALNTASTAALPATDGIPIWIRVTVDVNDGSGQTVVTYYYAAYAGNTNTPTWTQLGTAITTAGTTSIFDSTAAVVVGGSDNGTADLLECKTYRATLISGIGGSTVADFRPSADAGSNGATSWTASTGEVWTCAGTATIAAQSTNITAVVNRAYDLLLRIRIQETGGKSGSASDDYKLQANVASAGYTDLAASGAAVIYRASPSLASGATAQRLTSGSGSYVAGWVSEDGIADDLALTASNFTELLYSIRLDPDFLNNGDTILFRVLYNGATMTYSVTPQITVVKQPSVTAAGSITPSGTVAQTTTKEVVGAITPGGTVERTVTSSIAGGIAPSGDIVIERAQTASGAVTPTGALELVISRAIEGEVAPVGELLREMSISPGGAIAPSGDSSQVLSKELAGSTTPVGALAIALARELGGAIIPDGALAVVAEGAEEPIPVTAYLIGGRPMVVMPEA